MAETACFDLEADSGHLLAAIAVVFAAPGVGEFLLAASWSHESAAEPV